jgi:hypothetical protein
MPEPQHYRQITDELCQGDVFDRVPLTYVTEDLPVLKKATFGGKRQGYEIISSVSQATGQPTAPLVVAARCDYTRAVLLTFDCEIDKPSTKWLTFALVRPLPPNMPEADQLTIRENRKFAFFFLPPNEDEAPIDYVDFRRLGSVNVDLVKGLTRIARLSDDLRKAMLFQYFRYLTRIDFNRASLPPAEEELPLP